MEKVAAIGKPASFLRLLTLFVSLSLLISATIMWIALDHNPMREFCDAPESLHATDQCNIKWASLILLGSLWFVGSMSALLGGFFCHDRICSSVQKSVTQWVIFPRNGRHLEKGGMFAQEVINRDRQDERSGIQKGRESGDGERACDHSGLQSSASRRICHGV